MAVHQLLPRFAPGEPLPELALELRRLFATLGEPGGVHAPEISPGYELLAAPTHALKAAPQDVVLYHHACASPAANVYLHARARRWLFVHSVPRGKDVASRAARAELTALAPHTELALAFDALTRAQLQALGFPRVERALPLIDPHRYAFAAGQPGRELSRPRILLRARGTTPRELQALRSELRRLAPGAELALLTAEPSQHAGEKDLRIFSSRELEPRARALASSSVYLSLAEEGVSPLELAEALALHVPVLAFDVPPVEAALGESGVRFTHKHFALIAELCLELHRAGELRDEVLSGQARRLHALTAAAQRPQWRERLAPVKRPSPSRKRRRKLAIVVQRYGDRIVGGAERLAQLVATRLAARCDVTVLTTCAVDHLTWANALPPGRSVESDVEVLRFPVSRERRMRDFNALSRRRYGRPLERAEEEQWIAAQGPSAPALREHVARERDAYDAFLFFTYLYAPTVELLPLVHQKALHLPTAHDEPPFAFEVYRDLFELPRALLCNTPEELELISRRFPGHARARVIGAGVELTAGRPERFRKAHGVERPYLLYVGRLEGGKGIPEALALHARLRSEFADAPDFLIAGKGELAIKGDGVRALGPISEQDKHDALAGALAVVVPSRLESLSLLALEAFAAGTPVLVNAASEVLRGQVARSQAGFTYEGYDSFVEGVRRARDERAALSKRARAYAKQHAWPTVIAAYLEEIERVAKEST